MVEEGWRDGLMGRFRFTAAVGVAFRAGLIGLVVRFIG